MIVCVMDDIGIKVATLGKRVKYFSPPQMTPIDQLFRAVTLDRVGRCFPDLHRLPMIAACLPPYVGQTDGRPQRGEGQGQSADR